MRRLWPVFALSACSFDVGGLPSPGEPPPPDPPPSASSPAPAGSGGAPLSPPISFHPQPAPTAFDVGNTCDPMKAPCLAGELCTKKLLDQDIPSGYCTQDCRVAPCPTAAFCVQGFFLCAEFCPAAGCRPGLHCCTANLPAPGVCVPDGFCN